MGGFVGLSRLMGSVQSCRKTACVAPPTGASAALSPFLSLQKTLAFETSCSFTDTNKHQWKRWVGRCVAQAGSWSSGPLGDGVDQGEARGLLHKSKPHSHSRLARQWPKYLLEYTWTMTCDFQGQETDWIRLHETNRGANKIRVTDFYN